MERHPDAAGVMLAAKEDLVPLIESSAGGGLPKGLELRTSELEGLIDWADIAINTSGTVSLDLARQGCPMVAVYKIGLVSYIGSKFLLTMTDRLLPNIVAGRRIVPEFVPYLGGHRPIVEAVDELLANPDRLAQVRHDLEDVVAEFGEHHPEIEAADAIDELFD
jgi:lipid-A-disaccharide synthase